jgi:hypothetical protein
MIMKSDIDNYCTKWKHIEGYLVGIPPGICREIAEDCYFGNAIFTDVMQIAELSFSLCNLIDSLEIYVSLHR